MPPRNDWTAETRDWLALDPDLRGLTTRQAEIARLCAEGKTLAEIGERFGILPHSIKGMLNRARDRFVATQRQRS